MNLPIPYPIAKASQSRFNLQLFWGFWWIILWSLGQLQKWQLTSTVAIYGHDLIISSWVVYLLFKNQQRITDILDHFNQLKHPRWWSKNWRRWWQHHFSFTYATTLGLISWMMLGWVLSWWRGEWQVVSLWYSLRLLLYLVWAMLIKRNQSFPAGWLRFGLVAGSIWMGVVGLFQYWLIPDMRFLAILGWDDHYFRLVSTQFDPNFTGLLLVLGIIGLDSLLSFKHKTTHRPTFNPDRVVKLVGLVAKSVLVMSIALTFSRASLISLGSYWLIKAVVTFRSALFKRPWLYNLSYYGWVFWQQSWWWIWILIILWWSPKSTGEGVNLLRTSTITARWTANQQWLSQFSPHYWLVGWGWLVNQRSSLNPIGILNLARQPDNWLVMWLVQLGVGGTILALGWLWRQLVTWFNHDQYLWLMAVAILVHGWFNNSLLQPFVLLFFLGWWMSQSRRVHRLKI